MAKKKTAKNDDGSVEEKVEEKTEEKVEEKVETSEDEPLEDESESSEAESEEHDQDISEPSGEEAKSSDDIEEEATKKSIKKQVKLFNRWSFEGVEVKDPSIKNYVNLTPIIVPHSGGKHEHKRFWKSEHVNIIERFINKMMAPGFVRRRIKGKGSAWHCGKKQKCIKIVENAFTIIEERSGENPIQIFVDAIMNSAPREETTKISLGGISYQTSVDIAPQRRVDLGIRLLIQMALGSAYNNLRTIDECLASEIFAAGKNDPNSKAVKKKDEIERVAMSAR